METASVEINPETSENDKVWIFYLGDPKLRGLSHSQIYNKLVANAKIDDEIGSDLRKAFNIPALSCLSFIFSSGPTAKYALDKFLEGGYTPWKI